LFIRHLPKAAIAEFIRILGLVLPCVAIVSPDYDQADPLSHFGFCELDHIQFEVNSSIDYLTTK